LCINLKLPYARNSTPSIIYTADDSNAAIKKVLTVYILKYFRIVKITGKYNKK